MGEKFARSACFVVRATWPLPSSAMTDTPGSDNDESPLGDRLVALAARRHTVPDEIVVPVASGSRVLVFADLRMVPGGTDASREASRAIARAVEEVGGPGVIVLAGDTFDLLREGRPDLEAALAGHPRLAAALAAFNEREDRRIIVLPGTLDGALAHDTRLINTVQELGWEIALGCLLEVATG